MDNHKFVQENGFFFASSEDQLKWAKSQSYLIPLSSVINKITREVDSDNNMFVPAFYAEFKRKEQFPVWVWRLKGWRFREIKKNDVVEVEVDIGSSSSDVLARVTEVKENRIEVSLLTTHTCVWVPREKVRLLNQD